MTAQAKKILANAALTVFALACAFAFGEVMVRLLYKDETILYPRYHTDYHYGRYTIRGIRPNAEYWHTSVDGSWKFVTNSKGFRNTQEFTYAKPAGTLRVLSIGDSQAQGYEAHQDQTYTAVLERYLKQHKIRAEAINAGVSGFSNAEELVFLENEGVKYNPDVVVLGFSSSDFKDNVIAGLFSLDSQKQLVEERFEHVPGVWIQNVIYRIPGVKSLSENSYFYSLLFNSVWNFFKELKDRLATQRAGAKGDQGGLASLQADAKATQGRRSTQQADAKDKSSTAAVDDESQSRMWVGVALPRYQMELATALIERMHRFCKDRGIRFIVVDIPMPTILAPYRYHPSMPPALIEKLKADHVEYISSASVLQQFDGVAELYVPHGDHHISEFTHTLIGAELGRRLVTEESKSASSHKLDRARR